MRERETVSKLSNDPCRRFRFCAFSLLLLLFQRNNGSKTLVTRFVIPVQRRPPNLHSSSFVFRFRFPIRSLQIIISPFSLVKHACFPFHALEVVGKPARKNNELYLLSGVFHGKKPKTTKKVMEWYNPVDSELEHVFLKIVSKKNKASNSSFLQDDPIPFNSTVFLSCPHRGKAPSFGESASSLWLLIVRLCCFVWLLWLSMSLSFFTLTTRRLVELPPSRHLLVYRFLLLLLLHFVLPWLHWRHHPWLPPWQPQRRRNDHLHHHHPYPCD